MDLGKSGQLECRNAQFWGWFWVGVEHFLRTAAIVIYSDLGDFVQVWAVLGQFWAVFGHIWVGGTRQAFDRIGCFLIKTILNP